MELGEIEAALGELPGVLMCAALVLLDPVGAQRLVAYVAPATLDCGILASELKGRLPAHMVPGVIVPLEAMPLLPNEKIDRKVGTAHWQPMHRANRGALFVFSPAEDGTRLSCHSHALRLVHRHRLIRLPASHLMQPLRSALTPRRNF